MVGMEMGDEDGIEVKVRPARTGQLPKDAAPAVNEDILGTGFDQITRCISRSGWHTGSASQNKYLHNVGLGSWLSRTGGRYSSHRFNVSTIFPACSLLEILNFD